MRIIKHLVLLFLVIVAGDRIISAVLGTIYEETLTGQSGGSINYLVQYKKDISLLAIGDSRCAHNVVPGQISPRTYNLSHNGQSLIFQTGLIDQLLGNEELDIDTLLLHIDGEEAFSKNDVANRDIQHLKFYYDKNLWIRNEINKISRFEFFKYWFASYKWNGKGLNIINNRIKSERNNISEVGYIPLPATERDSVNVMWNYANRLRFPDFDSEGSINGNIDIYIQHISDLCDKNEVELICFTTPTYNPSENRMQLDNRLSKYFNKRGITYLNYGGLFHEKPELQSVWNWHDADHLNHLGAVVFSNALRQDLKNGVVQ